MPVKCVAYGCNNNRGHRFPKNEKLKKLWIAAIKQKKFRPTVWSRVCSDHFRPEDYATTSFDSGKFINNKINDIQ